MIWAAWRMQRTSLLVLAAVLLVGVVSFAVLRHDTLSFIDAQGMRDCLGLERPAGCGPKTPLFGERFSDLMKGAQAVLLVLPVLLGVFIGAPLFARELEQGTHVLALTQSVSRGRWFSTKTAFALLPATLLAQSLVWLLWWWFDAAGYLTPRRQGMFHAWNYGSSGLVPLGYTVFAVALGVLLGMATRRVVTAMTLTLVLATVVRFGGEWLRSLLLPTRRELYAPGAPSPDRDVDAQTLGFGFLNARGEDLGTAGDALLACDRAGTTPEQCYQQLGITHRYQDVVPGEAYWTVQLVEGLVLFGLAAVLLVLAASLLRRRSL